MLNTDVQFVESYSNCRQLQWHECGIHSNITPYQCPFSMKLF